MVTGTMDTTGRPTANRIILRNCVIWGARWDQKELKVGHLLLKTGIV